MQEDIQVIKMSLQQHKTLCLKVGYNLDQLRRSREITFDLIEKTISKILSLQKHHGIKLNPTLPKPAPIQDDDKLSSDSLPLITPSTIPNPTQALDLIQLQAQIMQNVSRPPNFQVLKNFMPRTLASPDTYTSQTFFPCFSIILFQFLNKYQPQQLKEIKNKVIASDGLGLALGGLEKKMEEANAGNPMPGQEIKKSLLILMQEVRVRDLLEVVCESSYMEKMVEGLVGFAVARGLGVTTVPDEANPKQLAEVFHLTLTEHSPTTLTFTCQPHSFTVTNINGAWNAKIDS